MEKLRFYNVEETAEILNLAKSKIYELINNGELPTIQLNGKANYTTYNILKWFVESQEEKMFNQLKKIGGKNEKQK